MADHLKVDWDTAQNSEGTCVVIVGGDLDYRFPGDRGFFLDGLVPPDQSQSVKDIFDAAPRYLPIHDILQSFSEATDDRPTFFKPTHLTEYTLDRVFISLPPWATRFLTFERGCNRISFTAF